MAVLEVLFMETPVRVRHAAGFQVRCSHPVRLNLNLEQQGFWLVHPV